jgi:hypothetical protein
MVPDPIAGDFAGSAARNFGLQHEVRHAIASRGEARPHVAAADQQGRSYLPRDNEVKRVGSLPWPTQSRNPWVRHALECFLVLLALEK